MSTEVKLWESIQPKMKQTACQMTRIESGLTACGIADITYVCRHGWSGWLESKVLATQRLSSSFMFGSPFTLQQWQWLIQHEDACCYRRSFLLVGQPGPALRGWSSYILVPARVAGRLATVTDVRFTTQDVLQWDGVKQFVRPETLLDYLVSEGRIP